MQLDPMAVSIDRRALCCGACWEACLFTMVMTIPQIVDHMGRAASCWGFALIVGRLSGLGPAVVLVGIRKGDKNIYLACVGWIVLDVAVILGVILYG